MQRKAEVKFGGAAMSLSADLSCLQGTSGAEHEAALATLEKQLICPICLEIFNKPVVILPCQHNLCRKCANELYQPSLFQARTTMMVNSGRFRCPSCRHEVVLDRHGVYGLPRNLLVENIIDVYKQEVSNQNAMSPAPLPPPAAQVTCSDHEGEKVNIYCLTCQVPTCSLCKVFGAHQSCQVAPLTDVYQQQKDELSEAVTSLAEFSDKVQGLIDELEESCRNIEENCKTQKQSVCDKFSRMFSILEERRTAMTQQISSEEEEKTGHAQSLVRCYGDSVEANSKLMESATSSMEEPDMAAFVQISRDLITKVITASTSGPSETLRPGYENLSHYSFNFGKQEEALKSIDFLKVVEDVPEELEVDPEPEEPTEEATVEAAVEPKEEPIEEHIEEPTEEPKEPLIKNTEAIQCQETSVWDMEVVGPVKELIPVLISPPVKPEQAPAVIPSTPALMRDAEEPVEEPAEEVPQQETENLDSNNVRSGQIKEEEKEVEECEAPAPVKEGTVCQQQEGMSTQQCEGGEAERRDVEGVQMKEGMDAVFYPSWYKPGSCRFSSVLSALEETLPNIYDAEQTTCSPPPTVDPPLEAKPEAEAHDTVQPTSEPQIQLQPQQIQLSQLLSGGRDQPEPEQPPQGPELFLHLQPQQHAKNLSQPLLVESASQPRKMPDSAFTSVAPHVQITRQTAGVAGIIEEEEEEEEEMQGWVCLPGAADKGFSLVEDSFDVGEDSFSDGSKHALTIPSEDVCLQRGFPEMGNYELSETDKREQAEDILALKGASELKEGWLRVSECEAEMIEEGLGKRSEELENDLCGLHEDALDAREDSSEVTHYSLDGDDGVKSANNGMLSSRDPELKAGISENKHKDDESREEPDVFNPNKAEEKITSSVSLQAVTLLFYLLTFLVILQRVWAYIGCFICT